MRRALVAALIAGATLLSASACSLPEGTDGDLNNQWPGMAAPVGWEPKAGECYNDFSNNLTRTNYKPVECTKDHKYETVHMGQFTGDVARLGLPETNGEAMKAVLAECGTKVNEFLGGNWRDGRIWIGVSIPSKGNWNGGARWWLCNAAAREDYWGSQITWKKTLKGEFTGASELKYGCYMVPKEDDADDIPTACTDSHNSEFAAMMQHDATYADLGSQTDALHAKCRTAIAAFAGVPNDGNLKARTGTALRFPSRKDWDSGEHYVRCHVYLGTKMLTRSVKGAGNSGLPINFR